MSAAAEIERKAATWLARREGNSWSEADEAAFQAWKSESTAHRIAVLRLESVWQKADRLRVSASLREHVGLLPEAASESSLDTSGRRRWLGIGSPRFVLPIAAAIALVFGVSVLAPGGQSYATPVGGFQELPLSDGSRIDLNTDTKLDIALADRERRVRLSRGEAFFQVAKDGARPFVVQAGDYRVVATGTAFSVRLDGNKLDVAVTEGSVRVECGGILSPTFVRAGQIAMAEDGNAMVRAVAADRIDRMLSWREGLLIFSDSKLEAVAAEFNRYNGRHLVVAPSAADVRVDGTFKASNLDGFLRLLDRGFGVRARPSGTDTLVLERPR